ncbi:MAG: hypothetical protein ABIE94_06355 [archaeon]
MSLKEPESMDECIYYTRRVIGNCKVLCWVLKEECPKCHKAMMGKPKGDKGKVKIRAKEYTCPECGYTVEKKEYEETLKASVKYTCPNCKFEGEIQVPFKRKSIQGVQTIRVQCEKCNADIDITKKMKEPKKK